MADGVNLIAKVPLSWKKSFSQGVVIPHKMRYCTECKKDILCVREISQSEERIFSQSQ